MSGGLDEMDIAQLLAEGAPIDAFGVGTRMDVSADAPYLDMAYKLVKYEGRHVLKTSEGKKTWTGEKQVWRIRGPDGRFERDVIALHDEPAPGAGAESLLRPAMRSGRALAAAPALIDVRRHCAAQLAALPDTVRRLSDAGSYPLRYSEALIALQRAVEAEVR